MYRLGTIGMGHMATVMLDGAVRLGCLSPGDVIVYDIDPSRRESAQARGFFVADCACAVYEGSVCLLLAVLPQNIDSALAGLAGGGNHPTVLSIVSGISSSYIRRCLGWEAPVIRAVPNLTMTVGFGATAVSRTVNVPAPVWAAVLRVLEGMGSVHEMDEALLTEAIIANGCSPGYAFYVIDAIARACEEMGVDYQLAVRMAAAAFAGAGKMLIDGGDPKAHLARVCSPGGLTARGIEYFDDHGLAQIIADGAKKSALRGRELARN